MKQLSRHSHAQAGVALVVALLMLLILSLLAVTSVEKVNISERIAGNQRDMNSAFQAAEAALLEGERWILNPPAGIILTPPTPSTSCSGSACATAVWDTVANGNGNDSVRFENGSTKEWHEIDWATKGRQLSVHGGTGNNGASMQSLANNPRYVIEYLGSGSVSGTNVYYFRVTARAVGVTPNSEVILQSIFRRT